MAFVMRTSKPSNNKFYQTKSKGGYSTCIKGKPTDASCDVLANCVGYACGRFNEIIGSMKYPSLNCNAENFIERAKNTYGLQVGQEPKVGAIMCWQKGATLSGSDGAGHVCVVEKVIDANTVYTSESGYGGSAFWNSTRKNTNGRWGIGSGYTFRGFIYNPSVPDEPTPTPTPTPTEWPKSYTVKKGDTLSGIAKKFYGNGSAKYYNYIASANGISNPNIIHIGQVLTIPEYKEVTPTPVSDNIKVGDYVVPTKLVDYKGTHLIQYDAKYQVSSIDNRGYVLRAVRGNERPIWAVLPKENIKKVG